MIATLLLWMPAFAGDRDGDDIVDGLDRCPDEAEDERGYLWFLDGCPLPFEDLDGDGFADIHDACPHEPEPKRVQGLPDGCPMKGPDTDRDGIADLYDRCPEQSEDFQTVDPTDETSNVAERLDGCPLAPPVPAAPQPAPRVVLDTPAAPVPAVRPAPPAPPAPPVTACARPAGAADVALTVLHSRSGAATVWVVGPDCAEVPAGVLRAKMETVVVPTWVGQRVLVREGEAPGGLTLHRFHVLARDVPARKIPSGAFAASGSSCHGVFLERVEPDRQLLFRCDDRESAVLFGIGMFSGFPASWPAPGATGTLEYSGDPQIWTRFTTDAGATFEPTPL